MPYNASGVEGSAASVDVATDDCRKRHGRRRVAASRRGTPRPRGPRIESEQAALALKFEAVELRGRISAFMVDSAVHVMHARGRERA